MDINLQLNCQTIVFARQENDRYRFRRKRRFVSDEKKLSKKSGQFCETASSCLFTEIELRLSCRNRVSRARICEFRWIQSYCGHVLFRVQCIIVLLAATNSLFPCILLEMEPYWIILKHRKYLSDTFFFPGVKRISDLLQFACNLCVQRELTTQQNAKRFRIPCHSLVSLYTNYTFSLITLPCRFVPLLRNLKFSKRPGNERCCYSSALV